MGERLVCASHSHCEGRAQCWLEHDLAVVFLVWPGVLKEVVSSVVALFVVGNPGQIVLVFVGVVAATRNL
jgi:hypothetical protein